jgi:glycosyltransferase involved in cell wall biosynthesis
MIISRDKTQAMAAARSSKRLFISWVAHCARSDSLARELGARSLLIHRLSSRHKLLYPLKYLGQGLDTLLALVRHRPDLIIAMNPPIFCVMTVYLYAKLKNIPFAIDSHSSTFNEKEWRWSQPLLRFFSKRAVVTIVTSDDLAAIVRSWGAAAYVIGAVPMEYALKPQPDRLQSAGDRSRLKITVVNTFSRDEPLAAVLEAARRCPDRVEFRITGNTRYADPKLLAIAPPNVTFTGFVARAAYIQNLYWADFVMVLTTRDLTMQRGAYEALVAGCPLILSDWAILRRTFPEGAVFVDNTAAGLAAGLETARQDRARLTAGILNLRAEKLAAWPHVIGRLNTKLEQATQVGEAS